VRALPALAPLAAGVEPLVARREEIARRHRQVARHRQVGAERRIAVVLGAAAAGVGLAAFTRADHGVGARRRREAEHAQEHEGDEHAHVAS